MTGQTQLAVIEQRLRVLEAREAIRGCLARYFDLCDVPGPFTEVSQLAELFTARATWRGIGEAYAGRFGTVTGRHRVAAHVASYLPPEPHFRQNAHLLGGEQLHTDGDTGCGQWLMQQLSRYADSSGELLCARIRADFVIERTAGQAYARIATFSTERLYAASLIAADEQAPVNKEN